MRMVKFMNFKETYRRKVEEIEQILRAYLPEQEGYQKVIMEAMEYSLMAGGKRLRPMLMKESYRLFGGESALIEPFMAAIEMIHTYSLVHDDLPAMDNDDYRRGRKTTHVVYGEDMGILAGDALLNYAFETAAKAFDMAPQASLEIGKAMQILAKKAGIYGMIGGQVVDVKSTKTTVSGRKTRPILRSPGEILKKIKDLKDRPLLLFVHEWSIRMTMDRNKDLILSEFGRS